MHFLEAPGEMLHFCLLVAQKEIEYRMFVYVNKKFSVVRRK